MVIMTLTLSGVTSVDFTSIDGGYPSNRFVWIKNKSSDAIYASATDNVAEGANGSTEIASGEVGMVMMSKSSMIYISGDGEAEIKASDFAECPFKIAGKGGGGSGGSVDYPTQVNAKPKLNHVTITGDKTFTEYGLEWIEPSVVADIFDSTVQLAVDDYIMYENKLYKCTNEHLGEWDVSDFELVTIMSEIISGSGSNVNVIEEPTEDEINASITEIWG